MDAILVISNLYGCVPVFEDVLHYNEYQSQQILWSNMSGKSKII